LNIDETGWWGSGINDYLCVFTDKIHSYYRIIHSWAKITMELSIPISSAPIIR